MVVGSVVASGECTRGNARCGVTRPAVAASPCADGRSTKWILRPVVLHLMRSAVLPLNFGLFWMNDSISSLLTRVDATVVGVEELRGHECVVVDCQLDVSSVVRFYFDLKVTYLSLRTLLLHDFCECGESYDVHSSKRRFYPKIIWDVLDVREVGPGLYVPGRCVQEHTGCIEGGVNKGFSHPLLNFVDVGRVSIDCEAIAFPELEKGTLVQDPNTKLSRVVGSDAYYGMSGLQLQSAVREACTLARAKCPSGVCEVDSWYDLTCGQIASLLCATASGVKVDVESVTRELPGDSEWKNSVSDIVAYLRRIDPAYTAARISRYDDLSSFKSPLVLFTNLVDLDYGHFGVVIEGETGARYFMDPPDGARSLPSHSDDVGRSVELLAIGIPLEGAGGPLLSRRVFVTAAAVAMLAALLLVRHARSVRLGD